MLLNVGWCGLITGSCITKKNDDILQLHVSLIHESIITMGHKIHVVTNGSLCQVRQCFKMTLYLYTTTTSILFDTQTLFDGDVPV